MPLFPRWPSALCALSLSLAAAVYAQERDDHRAPPPPPPEVEAALDDCWLDLGGIDGAVPPALMHQCMAQKGFAPPVPPPDEPSPPMDDDDDMGMDDVLAIHS